MITITARITFNKFTSSTATFGYQDPLEYIFQMEILVTALIAFIVSFMSGTLGLGGAVILIPAYLYLPGMFGLTPLDVKSITGMTSIQVFSSALFGVIFHSKRGIVNERLVLTMGIPITLSTLTGALFSKSVQPNIILAVFAVMAVIGAVFVFIKKDTHEQELAQELTFSVAGAIIIALVVGFFGGMAGAPGAFIISPLMMTVLKIPTRITIGSTLGIVVFAALAASIGKLMTGQVPYIATVVAVVSTIPGVYLGSKLSHRLPTRTLRLALAFIIAGVGVQMLYRVLAP